MNTIRIGDRIISARGELFEVLEHNWETIKAQDIERPHRERTFQMQDLFYIEDDLWQETEPRTHYY